MVLKQSGGGHVDQKHVQTVHHHVNRVELDHHDNLPASGWAFDSATIALVHNNNINKHNLYDDLDGRTPGADVHDGQERVNDIDVDVVGHGRLERVGLARLDRSHDAELRQRIRH